MKRPEGYVNEYTPRLDGKPCDVVHDGRVIFEDGEVVRGMVQGNLVFDRKSEDGYFVGIYNAGKEVFLQPMYPVQRVGLVVATVEAARKAIRTVQRLA
jgi:hypothetical protein